MRQYFIAFESWINPLWQQETNFGASRNEDDKEKVACNRFVNIAQNQQKKES